MRDGETDVGDRHFSKGGVKSTTDNQNERIKYRKKKIKQAKAKAVSKAQQEKWLGGVWWYGGGGVE